MKNYILITLLALVVVACGDPKEKLFNKIKSMEQSDTIATPEGLAMLAELHKEYGLKYQDSIASNYLYAAAMYYFYTKDPILSKPLFLEFIGRGDSTDRQRNSYYSLAKLYSDAQLFDSFGIMSDKLIHDHIPTSQQWRSLADMYDKKISSGYESNSADYENLSLSYTALGAFEMALESLDSAISKFPNAENRGNLLYRAGFIAWDYLEDAERAKIYYNRFIEEYPEHELAAEAKNILESGMIEMSDEEILEMLKAKGA